MGYAIAKEQPALLMSQGMDPKKMLKAVRNNAPKFNVQIHPSQLFNPYDQRNMGSCQAQALALIFKICFFLATGRIIEVSRMAAYILSQRKDGIQGDRGSTLSAGQWVATQHGLPYEKDWPYPRSYNASVPQGIAYPFKLVAAQPTRDVELIQEALDLGLPVQDGIMWDDSVSRTICTDYRGNGGGGHSTALWTKKDDLYRRINSWGMWDGDGCNENTPRALKQQVEHRFSSHVIYAPEGMIFPELAPVS
jgi:hypothetical protein